MGHIASITYGRGGSLDDRPHGNKVSECLIDDETGQVVPGSEVVYPVNDVLSVTVTELHDDGTATVELEPREGEVRSERVPIAGVPADAELHPELAAQLAKEPADSELEGGEA